MGRQRNPRPTTRQVARVLRALVWANGHSRTAPTQGDAIAAIRAAGYSAPGRFDEQVRCIEDAGFSITHIGGTAHGSYRRAVTLPSFVPARWYASFTDGR